MGIDRFNKQIPYNRIGRGNLAPHTINPLPIAIKYGICNGERQLVDIEGFLKEFNYLLQKAEESLLIRANLIFKQKMKVAYEMYVNKAWKVDYEYDPEKSVYEVLRHGSLVIGSIGWSEALIALFGKHHGESEESLNFLIKIYERMSAFCKEASERNNLNFANYMTPAETCCYTLMKKMKSQFGEIKGVTDHEYLTNSIHIPVFYEIGILDKLKKESKLAKLAPAGNIVYIEFDSTAVKNLKGIEQVIDFAHDQDIPYYAFNFPLDECIECGHSGEFEEDCPQCKSNKINKLRRVTGYITSNYKTAFNNGKIAETEARVKHTKCNKVEVRS